MRDTKESRLLLVLLVAIAFALITADIRGGDQSPLNGARSAAAAVFGPVENGVASAVNPVGNAIAAVRDSGSRHDRIAQLQLQNEKLKQQLGSSALTRNRANELDKLLKTAGAGQYGIKGAQVIAIGAAQGFSWTITIDAGTNDGIQRDMTVINGDGLVGRVTTASATTSTVLLACDPDFTVGTRMEKSMELGFGTGQGDRPMKVQLLDGRADVHVGDRLVTFGSQGDKPFVPGVPVGKVVRIDPGAGELTRTVEVQPFVSFSELDIVGVVVVPPRTDPRDTVLPPKPQVKPTPTVTVTVGPSGAPSGKPSGAPSGAPSDTPSESPDSQDGF
ncbi:rod shape-determining protein MreC [Streptomyces sp. ICBB 8177]|uniref:rod shape-determining protein MreC n=1 Tax=Streptomyces sp. ICBB 8177 TaxID=563922 RepID=UPI000D676017|nr:rod shape-determining protein MreC [Streptomyces sp. ICBB 8177]PWI45489.1 rod shape-determining protein MreC [Streptomyces sp. ICBB 8177]